MQILQGTCSSCIRNSSYCPVYLTYSELFSHRWGHQLLPGPNACLCLQQGEEICGPRGVVCYPRPLTYLKWILTEHLQNRVHRGFLFRCHVSSKRV